MTSKIQINKLLYEITNNSRIQKKKLSQILKASPQQINYIINKLVTDKTITFETVVDPARFGQITIMTFLVFTTFEKKKQTEILAELKECNNIASITQVTNGADLIIEYIVPNLSFFNKIHMEQLEKFNSDIKVIDVLPVIVRHIYNKKYLNKKGKINQHYIISGDRSISTLDENEKKVLQELIKNPIISINQLGELTNLDPRTALKTKKQLEKENIIVGYSANLNNETLKIKRQQLLIKFHENKHDIVKHLASYASTVSGITQIRKVIGFFDVMITVESIDNCDDVVKKIRDELKFYEYTAYHHIRTIKSKYISDL
ncbi:Lrp/AsnC family transcriptional regulator [Candidatus Woesearchaeota archaeon]|nr:Lrp/AsnC family transcriptional regulator [Candidatus Woesearchaeota archaeon]